MKHLEPVEDLLSNIKTSSKRFKGQINPKDYVKKGRSEKIATVINVETHKTEPDLPSEFTLDDERILKDKIIKIKQTS